MEKGKNILFVCQDPYYRGVQKGYYDDISLNDFNTKDSELISITDAENKYGITRIPGKDLDLYRWNSILRKYVKIYQPITQNFVDEKNLVYQTILQAMGAKKILIEQTDTTEIRQHQTADGELRGGYGKIEGNVNYQKESNDKNIRFQSIEMVKEDNTPEPSEKIAELLDTYGLSQDTYLSGLYRNCVANRLVGSTHKIVLNYEITNDEEQELALALASYFPVFRADLNIKFKTVREQKRRSELNLKIEF